MVRIVVNRSATLYKTFYVNGVAADPTGTPTAVVTRVSNGTTVTTGAVTDETEAGTWSVTIPATNNTLLDTLTVTWTGVVNAVAQTYVDVVEVAGDALFTIDQARDALGDSSYDGAKIAGARTYAETELENALGYALVPRYTRATLSGRYDSPLRLRPYVRAIRSVSVAGTALSAGDLALLTYDAGFLRGYGWPTGYSNVIVGYEHGLDYPAPGASRAALALAIDYLGGAPEASIDPRAESIVTVDGTIRLRSGVGQFSAMGVNEWVQANRLVSIA